MAILRQTFDSYANKKGKVESRMYIKMFKDSMLLNASLSNITLDLIFLKYKSRSSKALSYDEFISSLNEVAKVLSIPISDLYKTLLELKSPTFIGTKPMANRFHDDKSTYTGVHIHGGPSIG